MPFIHVKVAAPELDAGQLVALQAGMTSLIASALRKQAPLTAVLVEPLALVGWAVGGAPVACAAHVDVFIGAGSNSAVEKEAFVAAADQLLRQVVGAALPLATYVVLHELARESWGYGGLTQAQRAATAVAS